MLDFKDDAAPRFGQINVSFCLFLVKQKFLINGIFDIFDIKSTYVGPVILKKLKKF